MLGRIAVNWMGIICGGVFERNKETNTLDLIERLFGCYFGRRLWAQWLMQETNVAGMFGSRATSMEV